MQNERCFFMRLQVGQHRPSFLGSSIATDWSWSLCESVSHVCCFPPGAGIWECDTKTWDPPPPLWGLRKSDLCSLLPGSDIVQACFFSPLCVVERVNIEKSQTPILLIDIRNLTKWEKKNQEYDACEASFNCSSSLSNYPEAQAWGLTMEKCVTSCLHCQQQAFSWEKL